MDVFESPDNKKKRNRDEMVIGDATTHEDSPSKNLKLANLTVSNSSSGSDSEEESQELDDPSSQNIELKNVDRGTAKKNLLPSFQGPQHQGLEESQVQEQVVLELTALSCDGTHKDPFVKFLHAFSQAKLPHKIGHYGYNLTEEYDRFWNEIYDSPFYSIGIEIKLPNTQNMTKLEMKALGEIIRMGWEDERYWPTKFSCLFLESCLFEETKANYVNPETFLKFIDPADKVILLACDKKTVDQQMLDIFKKYCSVNAEYIRIGDDIKDSCIKAALEIMELSMKPIIEIWQKELKGLMPMSTFDFLMDPNPPQPPPACTWNDMKSLRPPHTLWKTFLLDWSEEQVKFYFDSLINKKISDSCNFCELEPGKICNAKHFLCACKSLLETLRLERHDEILKILLNLVELAIEKKCGYFISGNWKVLTYFRNETYVWPDAMARLAGFGKYPHIVVYSLSPVKRALIIEFSVSWEYWMSTQLQRKLEEYKIVKIALEEMDFEVEYRVFVLGGRGVLEPDLYNLFQQIFGMKHSEISKAHEEISREIFNVPFYSPMKNLFYVTVQ